MWAAIAGIWLKGDLRQDKDLIRAQMLFWCHIMANIHMYHFKLNLLPSRMLMIEWFPSWALSRAGFMDGRFETANVRHA